MASAATTVRVRGLRETIRALQKVNKEAGKTIRDELKKAAEPVAADTRAELSRYPGASTGTIGPRASVRGVFVTQRAKKVTGLRPDFGVLQMNIMEASLDERQDEIVEQVEDALDRLGRSVGF